MTYNEIKKLCRQGEKGKIPGWNGILKWDYSLD